MVLISLAALLTGCVNPTVPSSSADAGQPGKLRVLAVESFLADLAAQVGGSRVQVESLVPLGMDPHTFEPAPRDVARIAQSDVLIENGAGLENWLARVLTNADIKPSGRRVVQASAGLPFRTPTQKEIVQLEHPEGDPHFWLDPLNTIHYVENIRDGLIAADPAGQSEYTSNAQAAITRLQVLDGWISAQVGAIPADKRQIVTNHESFGYYADRYGFQIIGTLIPSVSTEASPSARELAQLIDATKAAHVRVVFLESGANRQLADTLAEETGVRVVADLYTHSLSAPGGPASTYDAMLRYDTQQIVAALK